MNDLPLGLESVSISWFHSKHSQFCIFHKVAPLLFLNVFSLVPHTLVFVCLHILLLYHGEFGGGA